MYQENERMYHFISGKKDGQKDKLKERQKDRKTDSPKLDGDVHVPFSERQSRYARRILLVRGIDRKTSIEKDN
jgi:hypothetical protein